MRLSPIAAEAACASRDAAAPSLSSWTSSPPAVAQMRRRTDGGVCLSIPGALLRCGSDPTSGLVVRVAPFLIDRELVSTTAYCRFLNSIEEPDHATLRAWFLIPPGARRHEHQLIERRASGWAPKAGAEGWPMVLVSWHGAEAYSLWANGADWRCWIDAAGAYLPSAVEWELAARGPSPQRWPWGDRDPEPGEINVARHERGTRYRSYADLPLASAARPFGVSPFGVLQMAGNVWQWCRDWCDPGAYWRTARAPSHRGARSERGGSWVGPITLARSSHRRGRAPLARGRCLGFRCVGRPTSDGQ